MTVPDRFYQHQDGGLYQVVDVATSTVDGTQQLVIYKHIYPFEQKLWARPLVEWTPERFKPISDTSARMLQLQDQTDMQEWIAKRKAVRKARETQEFEYALDEANRAASRRSPFDR